jgi:hypothetical protein
MIELHSYKLWEEVMGTFMLASPYVQSTYCFTARSKYYICGTLHILYISTSSIGLVRDLMVHSTYIGLNGVSNQSTQFP